MRKKKKYLFYVGHPAHWHNINNLANRLKQDGHEILIVIRKKDVLHDLTQSSNLDIIYLENKKKRSLISLFCSILKRHLEMVKIIYYYKPTIMAGTDIVISQLGKLFNIQTIIINEDNKDAIPLFALFSYPFATTILTPKVCDVGRWSQKQVTYDGYHELAYLNPDVFKPDYKIIQYYFPCNKKYFILRFSSLDAHHDYGKKGISNNFASEIIKLLEKYGDIYITSERELPASLEKFKIRIKPNDIHHVLYFAEMFIGDSQTMAAEAAVLGTPSLRFSDFTGKLNYLNELETKYGLTFGIPTSQPVKLLKIIKRLLQIENNKILWQKKSNKMLDDKINVANFFYWFFKTFPESRNRTNYDSEIKKEF